MPGSEFKEVARRLITERCLIAADIDKTILAQGHDREREQFIERVAPQILTAARLGTNLAFLTGNSMNELTTRFLKGLIDYLCYTDRLELLDQFHFFCNSGGVYAHFSCEDEKLKSLLSRKMSGDKMKDRVLSAITSSIRGELGIQPRFIDSIYIERCMIRECDEPKLRAILEEVAQIYTDDLNANHAIYGESYDLDAVRDDRGFKTPRIELRSVGHGSNKCVKEATVQITLKPILSFRHARKPTQLFGKDLRNNVTQMIQERLDSRGLLAHYVARPGGQSSIDLTLEKLDKAYALEFLIDHLDLQGHARDGQKFGSNAIYFGDEVIVGGGNDYPVTRIPGLLVFAVNFERELIPLLSHIFVPSTILEGPDATGDVLSHFNKCAFRLLKEFPLKERAEQAKAKTALETLKNEIFATRIKEKIASLKDTDPYSIEDWQTLHAFVTLMCRKDRAARQWLSILINELDAIMTHLATNAASVRPPAYGDSHPDC